MLRSIRAKELKPGDVLQEGRGHKTVRITRVDIRKTATHKEVVIFGPDGIVDKIDPDGFVTIG
jgi:hypothetical protein